MFGGKDISDDLMGYKAQVGYVPEEAHIYTYLTAPEYLRLSDGCAAFRKPASSGKSTPSCSCSASPRTHPLASFSKGMRQKVLISAALLTIRGSIVLDEPTSGLTSPTRSCCGPSCRRWQRRDGLVFYSSHELETTEKISTRVIIPARRRRRR